MAYPRAVTAFLIITVSLFNLQLAASGEGPANERRVVVESGGWKIVGDQVAGKGHATDILSERAELAEMLAVWFKYHLR